MKIKILFTHFLKAIVITAMLPALFSCQKDETTEVPDEEEFNDTINYISINDPEDAIQRIRFLYEYVIVRWGFYWHIPNVQSGQTTDMDAEFAVFQNFQHDPSTTVVERTWEGCYGAINLSNQYLNEVSGNPDIDAAKNIYKGQVYFYRALSYFTLVRLYGRFYPDKDLTALGVPIISGNSFSDIQRATVQEVYNYIINDLDSAASLLPEPSGEGETSKYAAMALAAHAHMWFQQYDEAELLLNNIIQSGKFSLLENYSYNFDGDHENSDESIFEFQFYWDGRFFYSKSSDEDYKPAQMYTEMIMAEYGGDASRRFKLTDDAVDILGNDPRAEETYYKKNDIMYYESSTIINIGGYANVKKYAHVQQPESSSEYGNNLILYRLADIYLLYSELQLLKNNKDKAIEYMNMVRERAGVNLITGNSLSSAQLMDTLRLDRYKELCTEGSYWYDLIRWDKAEEKLAYRGFIKGIHEVLPIPENICEINGGIVQNAGY
jgi:hypothetical protein